MKPQRRPKESIDRLPDEPVVIKRLDPESKRRALAYGEGLNRLLASYSASAELFGSVELEIATKGEWEFAIYLSDEQWFPVLVCLINHFGSIFTLIDDFAVFNTLADGNNVEIIPMRGDAALRNRAIMDYWRRYPSALHAYEQGKLEHAYSKREYYRWKDEHIAQIVEKL